MKVTGQFTIHVNPASGGGLTLVPAGGKLDDETVGAPATGGVTSSGGVPPVTFAVTNGSLPPGVSLDPATGALSGSPSAAGDAAFEITATDSQP